MSNEIRLGDKVKDRITGYEGIVTGITNWLNGCARIGVQSTKLKDGKPLETEWFDVNQIQLVKSKVMKTLNTDTGGPRPAAMRAPDPRRS